MHLFSSSLAHSLTHIIPLHNCTIHNKFFMIGIRINKNEPAIFFQCILSSNCYCPRFLQFKLYDSIHSYLFPPHIFLFFSFSPFPLLIPIAPSRHYFQNSTPFFLPLIFQSNFWQFYFSIFIVKWHMKACKLQRFTLNSRGLFSKNWKFLTRTARQ